MFAVLGFRSLSHFLYVCVIFAYILCVIFSCGCSHVCPSAYFICTFSLLYCFHCRSPLLFGVVHKVRVFGKPLRFMALLAGCKTNRNKNKKIKNKKGGEARNSGRREGRMAQKKKKKKEGKKKKKKGGTEQEMIEVKEKERK